jgi:hypothetical protein
MPFSTGTPVMVKRMIPIILRSSSRVQTTERAQEPSTGSLRDSRLDKNSDGNDIIVPSIVKSSAFLPQRCGFNPVVFSRARLSIIS